MAAYSDIGGLDSHPAPVFSFDGIGDFGHASQPNVIIVSQAGDSLNGDIPVLKPIGGFYERFDMDGDPATQGDRMWSVTNTETGEVLHYREDPRANPDAVPIGEEEHKGFMDRFRSLIFD